ncbi:hypothetical protein AVEN_94492-1 [Araneus ventricosus]|uniref:Uncharacterized protein n=1 Tax=Araneus ventricosus TaxID=182803 RepID=A0A4Y2R0M4_ARAVE|nr:hypothetical protein AVEN_94492-1 [Araneus ventricosus]
MRKTLDTRHAYGGSHGNGIFHCILGLKERALFHLAEMNRRKSRFALYYGRKRILALPSALNSPNVAADFIPVYLLSSTRLLAATLSRVFLLAVGQYVLCFPPLPRLFSRTPPRGMSTTCGNLWN